ncbi:hypothetical protein AVEN_238578-1 [Araneus ventricosus]|uniref:Uncharacterized protein n=1 Tax=Araneus ventricosus TaxID=182803 RepID=A0A4Y2P9P9_ARAVE|nr:hypothetical protein AVEN_238578-1 [Araneus ventricosus]
MTGGLEFASIPTFGAAGKPTNNYVETPLMVFSEPNSKPTPLTFANRGDDKPTFTMAPRHHYKHCSKRKGGPGIPYRRPHQLGKTLEYYMEVMHVSF